MDNVSVYVEQYMEKIFYYAMRRTGNMNDAQELASDISLGVIQQVKKEIEIKNLSAYIWKVAHNRYSVWSERKRKNHEMLESTDISDLQISSDEGLECEYAAAEELSLLRRELAFIASEYRDIVISYYIDNCTIRDIADKLGIAEGAVKMRLSRIRKKLKEGMSMAREFGIRSYNPEEIDFEASGAQPSGLPWSVIKRRIPKNILLQADNNPSSIEELAIELGVAMPYMEEEVKILCDATLLKSVENKYVTNFFIISKEVRREIYDVQQNAREQRSDMIDRLACDIIKDVRSLGACTGIMSDNDIKWWLIIYIIDYFIEHLCNSSCVYKPRKRMNGEYWGIVGMERVTLPEDMAMGHNGNGDESAMFWSYKIRDYGMWDRVGEMGYHQVLLLADVITKNRKVSSFTEHEKSIWRGIKRAFAHSDDDGSVIPDIVVLKRGVKEKIYELIEGHSLFAEIRDNIKEIYGEILKIINESNKNVSEDSDYYATMQMFNLRMMAVHDLVKNGELVLPREPEKSTAAMYIELK